MRWQFWIDVGGTFTDCVAASPGGELRTWKILSSGVVKGRIGSGSSPRRLVDPNRIGDPDRFWKGWRLLAGPEGGARREERDVVASGSEGMLELSKPLPRSLLGSSYELHSREEAPVTCIRRALELRLDQPIPDVDVRLGSTRGTNALLERKGARTAFLTTRGFADVLLIANQDRPELFALEIRKPPPLYAAAVEIEGRLEADGTEVTPLNESEIRRVLDQLREEKVESLAICLLHAYRNPEHEIRVEQLAREAGFDEISRSSAVAPVIKIVPRGETTVLDAYLTPVIRTYVRRIRETLGGGSSLKLMASHGGLIDGRQFSGKDSILSGPAGGVIACSVLGGKAGFSQSIGFDMGGTSTDVSRFGGAYELEQETVKGGVRIALPTLSIETVAAGGGSICSFDGVQLRVGPESAGADPGPACYGRGGPLTVTDANVALGRVLPERFPFPLDREAISNRLESICREIAASPLAKRYTPHELAQGFVEIANETMARAIRKISVQRGYDPAEHLLVSFGGAGGQHACALARALGIRSILIHPLAGLLSAYGIGLADVRRRAVQAVLKPCSDESLAELEPLFDEMESRLTGEVRGEGIPSELLLPPVRSLSLRYRGVESTLVVERPPDGDYRRVYEERHEQYYGYRHAGRPLEIVSLHVEVVGRTRRPASPEIPAATGSPRPSSLVETWFRGSPVETSVFVRDQLRAGHELPGPAIICDPGATSWIEPGFRASIGPSGEMLIRLETPGPVPGPPPVSNQESEPPDARLSSDESSRPDPITLELFNNRFSSIAEQMGLTLRRTSVSTNVKERLDYSCALFDPEGGLVVNAPHIPVHLGAMGETVRCILRDNPEMVPGDVFVTNDPFAGGSHLPDVTVVTPVHDPLTGRLLFLTASRAHHAEIGGITPGSMPPFSKNLAEEGVLIRNFKLVAAGVPRMEELRDLLAGGGEDRHSTADQTADQPTGGSGTPYPSRSPQDNLADVTAQVAANKKGAQLLQELITRLPRETVLRYMQHIQDAAALKMKRALAGIPDGRYGFRDFLDDGSPVQVAVTIAGERARIDFTGTGPVLPTNLNANRAIVTAAVMYVFRCLIEEPIPLNSGVLEPLELILPECLLNPPAHPDPARCAAVVGGNVETSQRVVDVLLGALGRAAASQGTMNNLTFGDGSFGYYETICGGAGATPHAAGADAVHTHMTNTRLTDVEVFEHRYPVRVEQFRIRRGSGGDGTHRGGDGVLRTFLFQSPLSLSLLTQRRGPYPPFGLNGGKPGAPGRNQLQRGSSPEIEELGGLAQREVQPGDRLTIETPGGGGFG